MTEVLRFVKNRCISLEKPLNEECPVETGQVVSASEVWKVESPTAKSGTRLLANCPVCGTTASVEKSKV